MEYNPKSKFLILLPYYERPEMVKMFLRSLMATNYPCWQLAFIDDGSTQKGKPIAEKILKTHLDKVVFHDTGMSPMMKKYGKGSYIGHFMNRAIACSDADIVINSGDDDEMLPDYMSNLDRFFSANPTVPSCYSDTYVFNPMDDSKNYVRYSDNPNWKGHKWFGKPINCAYQVDGIQVAFRRRCCAVEGASFPYPNTINLDALFLQDLHDRCGPSPYSGFAGMCKGRHDGQLLRRPDMAVGVKDRTARRVLL